MARRARTLSYWSLAAAELIALGMPGAAWARPVRIDIPATTLAAAVETLSKQAGVAIGAEGPMPALRTPPVRGTLEPADALARLLAGSGFAAVKAGPAAYRIAPRPQRSVRPPIVVATAPTVAPDIVVTGLKRTLALAQAPLSISVVAMADLPGWKPLPASADVAAATEGLTLTNLGPGRNRQYIRGIADSPFNGPTQSTVAVLLDDARVTYDAPDPDLRLVDVERVEILKGPQGPLYGTGSLGGIVHIVTNAPDLTAASASARAFATAVQAGGEGAGGEAVVNAPLVEDRLALRLAGYASVDPGWIDNAVSGRDANRGHTYGGRATLLWQIAPRWSLDTGGAIQIADVEDSQYLLARGPSLVRPNVLAEPHDNDFRAVHATLKGAIRGLDLVTTGSWIDQKVDSVYDVTPVAASLGPAGPARFDDDRRYTIFNAEARLSNDPAHRFSWVAGGSLLIATRRVRGSVEPAAGSPVTIEDVQQRTSEVALFGEAAYRLTDTLRATAGARAFHANVDDELAELAGDRVDSRTRTHLTPSAAIDWSPDDRHQLYLRYARALRPGGLSPIATSDDGRFASDELANFDLGTRIRSADSRFSLSAAAYLTFWQNVQSDYLLANGIVGTRNAGDARIGGVEATLAWKPVAGWTLSAGGTVQHARLVRSAAGVELSDTRLPVVPDVAGRLSASRAFRIGGWSGQAQAQANYYGPERLSFDADLDRQMGDYVALSGGATVSRGPWSIGAGIDNLLNVRADSFAFGNPFTVRMQQQVTPLRPRTVTVTLGRRW